VSQRDRAEKRVAVEGMYADFAAALSRTEPCRRTRNYRRGRKKNLSRARRRLDREVTQDERA